MTGERKRLATLHGCLKHERRRYVLYRLEKEGGPVSIDALAEDLVDRESEGGGSDVGDRSNGGDGSNEGIALGREGRAEEATTKRDVVIELHHSHLPRLAAADLVRYDHEDRRVELAEYPAELVDEDAIAAN